MEGQAPALAAHASDDTQFFALLREILLSEIATKAGPCALLLNWFAEFYSPWKTEWDFSSADEYAHYVQNTELRTLQGERVRSFEELMIANWLYFNGIAYEYEPDYEHALPGNNREVELVSRRCGKLWRGQHPIFRTAQRCRALALTKRDCRVRDE